MLRRQLGAKCTVAALIAISTCLPIAAWAAESAGTTTIVENRVIGSRDENERLLVTRDDVFVNEKIVTGNRAKAEVALTDGTRLKMGPDSEAVLDKFVYDPSGGAVALKVASGVARFITGSMPHDSYSIETPTATIGVRGTDFSMLTEDGKMTVLLDTGAIEITSLTGKKLTLEPGEVAMADMQGNVSKVTATKSLLSKLSTVRVVEIYSAAAQGAHDGGRVAARGSTGGTPGGDPGGSPGGPATGGGGGDPAPGGHTCGCTSHHHHHHHHHEDATTTSTSTATARTAATATSASIGAAAAATTSASSAAQGSSAGTGASSGTGMGHARGHDRDSSKGRDHGKGGRGG